MTDGPYNGDGGLINGLIYHGELDKAQALLNKRPLGEYRLARARLCAAKGEISKIDTAFNKNGIIQLMLNKNKILKDQIPRLDKIFDQRKLGDAFGVNYDVLKNNTLFKQYQEDPDFKKLLAKAKDVHEAYLAKYGLVKVVD